MRCIMKANFDFVIWRDVPVIYQDRHGIDRCGDVPVFRVNPITGKGEKVVNTRGLAYGARLRKKYRRNENVLKKEVKMNQIFMEVL